MQLNINLQSMISVKYNEHVQYNKDSHISDGSIEGKKKKVRNNYTKTSYMRFQRVI